MLFQNVSAAAICLAQESKGANKEMTKNPGVPTEVLHSEEHSKLSAEEIAKAVARHKKNHPAEKAENAAAKAKKVNRK
jgi:hypothetical protein